MKKMLGKDVYVSVGGKVVALSSNCSISVSQSLLEVAPRQSSRAREYITDRYAWQATFDALIELGPTGMGVGEDVTVAKAVADGRMFRMYVGSGISPDDGGPSVGLSGSGYFTEFEEQAAVGSYASYRATITGSGPLTFHIEE